MIEYKSAYSTYASAVNAYHSAAYSAKSAIEQSKAKATAQGLLSDYDDALTQKEIFNRLTNNGATQGIYMSNGKLYINASYMSTGIISDKIGRNAWNLNTGALTTNYMTANYMTANGTFKCGYSNYYTMLNNSGQMSGYRTDNSRTRSVGYIDYSSSSRDTSTGALSYGLQLQAEGIVRVSTPKLSISTSSNYSVTTTNAGTGTLWLAGFDHNPGDGWSLNDLRAYQLPFVNGICTRGF